MKIALLLFAFTIFLIPTIASADVIPDNWLTIPICTKIENINLFPDYTFILFNQTPFDSRYLIVKQNECFDIKKSEHPELFAIKKTDFKLSDIGENTVARNKYFKTNPKLIKSDLLFYPSIYAPTSDPRSAITDILTIQTISDAKLNIIHSKAINYYVGGTSAELPYDQRLNFWPEPTIFDQIEHYSKSAFYFLLPIMALGGIIFLVIKNKKTI